jgi:hypothetical protein
MKKASSSGRPINAVYWPDTDTEKGRCLIAGAECGRLYMETRMTGGWIIQERDGREVARHNPAYIESIIWEQP